MIFFHHHHQHHCHHQEVERVIYRPLVSTYRAISTIELDGVDSCFGGELDVGSAMRNAVRDDGLFLQEKDEGEEG